MLSFFKNITLIIIFLFASNYACAKNKINLSYKDKKISHSYNLSDSDGTYYLELKDRNTRKSVRKSISKVDYKYLKNKIKKLSYKASIFKDKKNCKNVFKVSSSYNKSLICYKDQKNIAEGTRVANYMKRLVN